MVNRNVQLGLVLVGVLVVFSGCARWRLLPQRSLNQAVDQAASQGPSAATASRRNAAPTPQPAMHGPVQPASHNATIAGGTAPQPVAPHNPDPASDDSQLDPSLAIARLSERQDDYVQAGRLYQEYIQKNPSHPVPYHRLGVMAAEQTKFEEAEQYFRKALQLAPPTTELLNDLGYCCYLTSRLDEAERYLQQALQQSPDDASACNNLALVYGARGDFEKCLGYFRRVNTDAKAHANLAYIYSQHHELDKAKEEYLKSLTLDNELRTAASALLQVEKARNIQQQTAEAAPASAAAPPHPAATQQLPAGVEQILEMQPSTITAPQGTTPLPQGPPPTQQEAGLGNPRPAHESAQAPAGPAGLTLPQHRAAALSQPAAEPLRTASRPSIVRPSQPQSFRPSAGLMAPPPRAAHSMEPVLRARASSQPDAQVQPATHLSPTAPRKSQWSNPVTPRQNAPNGQSLRSQPPQPAPARQGVRVEFTDQP